jgi:hypothetical protein
MNPLELELLETAYGDYRFRTAKQIRDWVLMHLQYEYQNGALSETAHLYYHTISHEKLRKIAPKVEAAALRLGHDLDVGDMKEEWVAASALAVLRFFHHPQVLHVNEKTFTLAAVEKWLEQRETRVDKKPSASDVIIQQIKMF